NMLARSDRAAARALFLEALEFDRKDSRIWMALAHLAETPGQSVATLRELLTLEPAHAAGRSLLKGALVADARALHARGGAAAAVERLKESLAIDDRNIDAWLCLSEVSADGDESARALDMAAAIDPADVRVLAAVARMREQLDAVADVSAASFDRLAAPASLDGLDNLDGDDGFAQFDIVEATPAPPEPAPAPEPVAALTPPPAPAAPPAARTILIVDDSPTIRKILALTLERAGYTVVAEPDGEAALKRLEDIVPSLIFLDIAMPNLDGYEVCKQIRKGARTAAIPVVMLSGKDAFFDKVKGKMAGATEYLTKPFETPVVLSVAATHCQPAEEVVHG
ncbi:MAG TPA: response regulator, partial [Vicinamibacterales bacterium]|nr:response regulator [Vicinamibacterales bacterium]